VTRRKTIVSRYGHWCRIKGTWRTWVTRKVPSGRRTRSDPLDAATRAVAAEWTMSRRIGAVEHVSVVVVETPESTSAEVNSASADEMRLGGIDDFARTIGYELYLGIVMLR